MSKSVSSVESINSDISDAKDGVESIENKNLTFQIIDWYSENYDKRENNNNLGEDNDDNDNDNSDNEDNESDDDEPNYDSDNDDFNDGEDNRKVNEDKTDYKIYIFGKDLDEKTYCVEVNNFTPYFYVRLPDYSTETTKKAFESWVRSAMYPKFQKCLIRTTLLEKHSFRNFDNKKKYKFVRLVFRNTSAMRNAISLFQNKEMNAVTNKLKLSPKKLVIPGVSNTSIQYDLYENMIDPLLKFIHHKKLKPVGWVKIMSGKFTVKPDEERTSHCNYEISVDWTNIKPYEEPNNSKMKIMAYDIECDSAHGDFPLPKKDYTKIARDIFTFYQRIDNCKIKLLNETNSKAVNKEKIAECHEVLENREEFTRACLESAFHQPEEKLTDEQFKNKQIILNENSTNFKWLLEYMKKNTNNDINKVFTKNKQIPGPGTLDFVARKVAPNLIISTAQTTNDRKRENTRTINKIIKVLNEFLPQIEGDTTIQAAMSFIKYGETTPYRNIMLTVGTCIKLSNAETYCFKNEKALLKKFRDIIIQEDPEVITGYNTDGFDTPWLFKRAEELGIMNEFSKIGRFINFESVLKEKQVKGPTGELIKKEYVEMPGRIQVDILPLVMKGYQLGSYKLDDVSAEFINGKIKELVYNEDTDETTVKTDSVKGLHERNFIMFNEVDGYLENKYKDGEKYEVYNIQKDVRPKTSTFIVKGKIELDLKNKKCNWCLGKDDVSPKDIFRLQKGNANDRYIIAKYCMMDVILCIELLNKLELITNNIGMANVCLNPLSWIIHRGQGIKILSLVAYFISNKDYLLPYLYKDSFDKEGYEGAVVLDPQPKIYLDDEPVAVLDYGSLYPSSMREKNISHETIVTDPKYLGEEGIKELDRLGYDYEDVSYDTFKTIFTSTGNVKEKIKIGVKTVRYVQYRDKTKGIIPQILEYLVNARKSTRKKITWETVVTESGKTYSGEYNAEKKSIKTENGMVSLADETIVSVNETFNKFQQQVLDGLQLAFKITANSLYGQVGAKTSDIYYKELAASTTSVGRGCLIIAKEYVENPQNFPHQLRSGETVYLNNRVVYGDTDSVFVKYQCLDEDGNQLKGREARKKSIELGIYSEKEIGRTKLKEPQVLEYEKTFHPFILFSKKRYVGNKYEFNPDEYKRTSMGIVLKRRDNAPIVKVIFGGIIDIIMKENDIRAACTFLRKTLRDLVNGKFGMDTLIITKTLSSYYKNPESIAHKVLADRIAERDPGNKPQVNDRIPFVYFDTSKIKTTRKLLQGEMIETPEYVKKNNLMLNYEFYIQKQILKPVSQIFSLCLDQIPGFYGDMSAYDKQYRELLATGLSNNKCIKKVLESKRRAAAPLLFGDILRTLENKRKGFNEITSFLIRPNKKKSDDSD